jgi:hypothetical protein
MGKSRKSRRSSIIKSIRTTADRTLPSVNKGLTRIGTTAKDVASVSVPVIEKGVSVVYGTMSSGLDLGVKGAKSIAKGVSKRRHSRKHRGGRRTRHRRSHRRY